MFDGGGQPVKQTAEGHLKRNIGLAVAMSIVIGTVIGSGIFMKPGIVISSSGGSSQALLAWVLGGILTLAGGLTIAEVSTQIPKTGGLYVYLEEVYGEVWGYLCGWVQTVIYGPAVIGALGLYFGSLFTHLFSMSDRWSLPVGLVTVLFLALMNSLGTRYGGIIQTAATVGKLIPIVLIAVFGLWKGNLPILGMSSGIPQGHGGMGEAILATLWAYDGWILVGLVAGELKNPGKMLPRAIIGGISIVTVAYLLVNIAMFHVLSVGQIVQLGEHAAGTAAGILFGPLGGKLLSVGILISIFGCLNGKIFTFPRIPFAMAERGQLPFARLLSRVPQRMGTPVFAICLEIAIAYLLMLVGNPDRLSDIAIFAVFIFYLQAFYAVFLLRKHPRGPRVYSVPGYPLVPLLAIAGSAYVVINTLITNPHDTLLAILMTLLGLPLYVWLRRGETGSLAESSADGK